MDDRTPTPEEEFAETRVVLQSMSHRRFGSIPEQLVIDHLLKTTQDADFPVRKAALEALLRRQGFAQRDQLRIASRPHNGTSVLGEYTTRGTSPARPAADAEHTRRTKQGKAKRTRTQARRKAPRPYVTRLESVEPLAGSCTCPDYLRGSLGLCKHLLVVMNDVFGKPRKLATARAEQRRREAATSATPALRWQPVRPLVGEGDRLAGLVLVEPAVSRAGSSATLNRARRWFDQGRPKARALADPAARRELIENLRTAARRGSLQRSRLAADPAAAGLLEEELERVDRVLTCRRDARHLVRSLRGLKRKLYPYQREGVERFFAVGRLLLADDMGLGKTVQAVAACHALYHSRRVRRGLLIVPAALKSQWLREWQATSEIPAAIVEGRPDERARQYRKLREGFLIINYELLLRDLPSVHQLAPEIVVLDEAQRIKNWATKSAVYVKSLTPSYRLVLTGTPMENRLEELASILDWIDDLAMAPKWRLVPWHTRWEGAGGRPERVGARNLDTLRQRLRPCLVRRVRKEVLSQLPPRTDTRVPVEMTAQQATEHDDLNQPIAVLLRRAKQRPLTQKEFLRLMQLLTTQRIISNGLGQLRFDELWPTYARLARPEPALLEGLFAPKLSEFRRLLAEVVVEQERKVVVFSQWRRMLRLAEWSVRDICQDAGVRPVFFTGAESSQQRTRAVVDFHDEPQVRVMFLSDAGGVGLNLQRAATCCINLEMPWNPAVLEQRIGRIYRLGQKHPIDVYNLITESGIEARIASLVGTKQALFTGLFDGSSDEVTFDHAASFLSQVRVLTEAPALPELGPDRGDTAAVPAPPEDDDATELLDADSEQRDDRIAESAVPPRDAGALTQPTRSTEPPIESRPTAAPSPTLTGIPAPPEIPALFGSVQVRRTESGGISLEAPPEAAASLVALFEGMAKLLGQAVQPRSETDA